MATENPTVLEPSGEEMRRLVAEAMERIVAYVESLPEQPAADVEGAVELARSLVEPPPEGPRPLDELLELLFERAVPRSFNAAGPGYLGYIPGGGIFASAVADLIAGAVNRYTGVFAAAPALVQLEANVLSWFATAHGLSAGGPRPVDERRLDGPPDRAGDRPARPPGRGLPGRHPLPLGPDPLLGREGRGPRRLPGRQRARGAGGRGLPDPARRPGRGGGRGPPPRAHAVPGGGQRRHGQHRRRRSLARASPASRATRGCGSTWMARTVPSSA